MTMIKKETSILLSKSDNDFQQENSSSVHKQLEEALTHLNEMTELANMASERAQKISAVAAKQEQLLSTVKAFIMIKGLELELRQWLEEEENKILH